MSGTIPDGRVAELRPERGRKRNHDPETELQMILDAAHTVMRRKGFEAATVAEILAEAGLSTRAFYRHFDSNDALLIAMYRHDAEHVMARLQARVDGAPDVLAALDAYIDEYLSLWFDPRKARRAGAMTSKGARRAAGYIGEEQRTKVRLAAPLVKIIERGVAEGILESATPERDAETIGAVIVGTRPTARDPKLDRDTALEHVKRFCYPALGISVADRG